jgi:prophage DNA circulation protein
MSSITDIKVPWRDALRPAAFRGAVFHVETGSKESGQRIVVHEFPKRDLPYSESMGRRAMLFSVRGYCITYPFDAASGGLLYRRDYRIARDVLINELETEGPGVLQLPTLKPCTVVCQQYRWTEEERIGGYCVFDMSFAEAGDAPAVAASTRNDLIGAAKAANDQNQAVMAPNH